ncbi:Nuclear RNA export factor 1 [Clonorchis sinensis]|uniref:Nuclear RNA export factor 1/2 n=2 Tax=Clonorchis sinensis TaxID=79923 RepID=G7Y305_CLOSI|nr:Nuclear RNA export factor 1 [Clonorchis sinensis]GAA47337.1 nuclear RNA export factor 1/2 [Clonorchis sinensis]
MPHHGQARHKSKFNGWNQREFRGRHDNDGSGDHLPRATGHLGHRRDGFGGGRRSFPSDMLKRAVAMNLLPTPSGSTQAAQNTGLAHGESWARITVVHGATQPLNAVQEMVNTALGTQLRFYNVCIEGRNSVLYAKIRQRQLMTYRKALQSLRDPSDNKTFIGDITLVHEPRVPQSDTANLSSTSGELTYSLPDSWVAALRRCFVERFHAGTRNLDLSSLHTDPTLLSQGLYLPLNKTAVVHAMVNILKENAAKLSLLNLSSNRLNHLNSFSPLAANPEDAGSAVSIERIDVSANPLTGLSALAGLRGIAGLVELDIADTPVAAQFRKSDRTLVGNLLKAIPGLKKVNGEELQSVRFAIEHAGSPNTTDAARIPLPPSTLGYFPNDEVRIPLLSFLKEYFTRYDTKPRGENLLPYYTSASQLVLSVATDRTLFRGSNIPSCRIITASEDGTRHKTVLTTCRLDTEYVTRSRNLMHCHNEARRKELVARGSLACAALLAELPPTEHPLESFTVDVAFHSPTQMVFTVTGVFYEIHPLHPNDPYRTSAASNANDVRKVLRCFSRTMILVAPGGHVLQDDLLISCPSEALCKKYIKSMASKATTQPTNPTPSTDTTVPSVSSSTPADAGTQALLITELKQRSGMNEAFSRQCLEEYQWNFEAAFAAFEMLRNAGKLPPEAFV